MKSLPKILGILSLFVMFSCMHDIPVVPTNPSDSCSPDTIYFAQQIQPLINNSCAFSGCHDDASHAEGVRMDTYSNIVKEVKAGKPTSSKLYEVLLANGEKRMPPAPYDRFSQNQIDLIYTWISQGAKNNSCTLDESNCVSVNMSYANDIAPIMATYCNSCHGGSANLGNLSGLDTYAGLKKIADNGSLLGSVSWSQNFVPMPYTSSKLSDCKISKISAWIAEGALNN